MPSWRGLVRCMVLVILLNTRLDLCTCDLLEGLLRSASPNQPVRLDKPVSRAPSECCDHCENCVCCALTLVAGTVSLSLNLAISEGPIFPIPALSNPEPSG